MTTLPHTNSGENEHGPKPLPESDSQPRGIGAAALKGATLKDNALDAADTAPHPAGHAPANDALDVLTAADVVDDTHDADTERRDADGKANPG